MLTRRTLTAAPALAFGAPASYATPYKLGHLVLEASHTPGAFDTRSVDCPFVFHHAGRFHMTYYSLDKKGKARDLVAGGDDPFHPVKSSEILIDVGPPGSVDETYAHKPSVIWHDRVALGSVGCLTYS